MNDAGPLAAMTIAIAEANIQHGRRIVTFRVLINFLPVVTAVCQGVRKAHRHRASARRREHRPEDVFGSSVFVGPVRLQT